MIDGYYIYSYYIYYNSWNDINMFTRTLTYHIKKIESRKSSKNTKKYYVISKRLINIDIWYYKYFLTY